MADAYEGLGEIVKSAETSDPYEGLGTIVSSSQDSYEGLGEIVQSVDSTTAAGTFGREAALAAAPLAAGMWAGGIAGTWAGGLAGAKVGAAVGTGAAPGVGTVGGSIIGGLAGLAIGFATSMLASKAQDWGLESLIGADSFQKLNEVRAQGEKEHPIAAFAGGTAPMLIFGKPAYTPAINTGKAAKALMQMTKAQRVEHFATKEGQTQLGDFINVALGGPTMAGVEAYQQIKAGEFQPIKLIANIATGTLLAGKWGEKQIKEAGVPTHEEIANHVDPVESTTIDQPVESIAGAAGDVAAKPDLAGEAQPAIPIVEKVELPKPPDGVDLTAHNEAMAEIDARVKPVEVPAVEIPEVKPDPSARLALKSQYRDLLNTYYNRGESTEVLDQILDIQGKNLELAAEVEKDFWTKQQEIKRIGREESLRVESAKTKNQGKLAKSGEAVDQNLLGFVNELANRKSIIMPKPDDTHFREIADAQDELGKFFNKRGKGTSTVDQVLADAKERGLLPADAEVPQLIELLTTKQRRVRDAERPDSDYEAMQKAFDAEQAQLKTDEEATAFEFGGKSVEQTVPAVEQSKIDEPVFAHNKAIDAQREELGWDRLPPAKRETGAQWMAEANRRMDNDPSAGQTLVKEVVDKPSRPVDNIEQMMIIRENYEALTLQKSANEKVKTAKNDEELTRFAREADVANKRVEDANLANRKAGSVEGKAMRARQFGVKSDFTVEDMRARARNALNQGKELNPEQSKAVNKDYAEIKKADDAVIERQKKLQGESKVTLEAEIDNLAKKYKEGGCELYE